MLNNPTAIRNRPTDTTTRRPTLGRIRCIVAPRAMIGTATGPSAQAVWSGL